MSKSIYDTRRENLRQLLLDSGRGSKQKLAALLGWTPTVISHYIRAPEEKAARKIHEDTARRIEEMLGQKERWLDTESAPLAKAVNRLSSIEAPQHTEFANLLLAARKADDPEALVRKLLKAVKKP